MFVISVIYCNVNNSNNRKMLYWKLYFYFREMYLIMFL